MAELALPNQLTSLWQRLHVARLWRDPLSVGLIVTALVLNVLTLLDLLLKLRPLDGQQVPTYYSNIIGFDQLSSWYHPYTIAIFALFVTTANTLLGTRAFGRSRVASFYLLLGGVVVAVFALIIANAFSSIS